jgi:cytosine/adenosine deaminase-related metal-dependent hydrolase
LTAAAVSRAKEAGLWLVHNPRSNEGNRLPYARPLGAGAHVALGTDGWPAQMGVELAALERLARADDPLTDVPTLARRRVLAGRALATEVFGLPRGAVDATTVDAWALRAGEAADLVIAPSGWPSVGRPRHVLVAGRVVVEDGVLKTADLEEIQARAREEAPKLWRRMEALP